MQMAHLAQGELGGAVAGALFEALPESAQLLQTQLLAQLLHVPVVQQLPAVCSTAWRLVGQHGFRSEQALPLAASGGKDKGAVSCISGETCGGE